MMSLQAQAEVLALTMLAAVCGAAIGLERGRAGKAAGLRTHILIAAASALATGTGAAIVGGGDPTRVLHGVLTGIGFLGSGVIFRENHQHGGHTSAAAVMLTAMVGAVCGLGAPLLALGTTLFAIAILWRARGIERHLHRRWESQAVRRDRRARRRNGLPVSVLLDAVTIDLRDDADASAATPAGGGPAPRRRAAPEDGQPASSNL